MPLWHVDYFWIKLLEKEPVQGKHSDPPLFPWEQETRLPGWGGGGGGILPTQRVEGILTSRDRDWQRQWHKHTLLLLHSFATRSPSPPFWSNLHKSLPLYLKRYINRLLQSLPRCHTLGTYVLKKLNLGFFLLLLCRGSIYWPGPARAARGEETLSSPTPCSCKT